MRRYCNGAPWEQPARAALLARQLVDGLHAPMLAAAGGELQLPAGAGPCKEGTKDIVVVRLRRLA